MKLVIACSYFDEWRARICAISAFGFKETSEIEFLVNGSQTTLNKFAKRFGVALSERSEMDYSWGFLKLELLFSDNGRQRFFVVDADTILLRDFSILENDNSDFVVDDEGVVTQEFDELYYPREEVQMKFQSKQAFPSFAWNTGQWIGTSGIIDRKEFDGIVDWSGPQSVRSAPPFPNNEMGGLNLVVYNAMASGRIELTRAPLMYYPKPKSEKKLREKYVLHWAGMNESDWLYSLPHASMMWRGKPISFVLWVHYFILRHYLRRKKLKWQLFIKKRS